jgi:hypothetical protein
MTFTVVFKNNPNPITITIDNDFDVHRSFAIAYSRREAYPVWTFQGHSFVIAEIAAIIAVN